MIGRDFEDPDWWRRERMPFTQSFGGDSYCVRLTALTEGAARPVSGPVIDFWHDEPTRNVLAPSLTSWFGDLVATMEAGKLELA